MADFQQWKNNTLGQGWDIDGSGDWDCVDMAKSWAVFLYGDWVNTIGYGNAKDLFYGASDYYFDKIVNDVNDPNQLPQQGDIMMFDATPHAGYTNTYNNPYGHTGVLDSADGNGYTIIAQASGTGQVAHLDTKPWKYRPCIGWLRPKDLTPAPAPEPTPEPQPEPAPAPQPEPTPTTTTNSGQTTTVTLPTEYDKTQDEKLNALSKLVDVISRYLSRYKLFQKFLKK